jgi:hypothetical protein
MDLSPYFGHMDNLKNCHFSTRPPNQMLNTNEYDKLIKCDFNVIITKTKFQHLIVQDIYREVGWELSEVEKIVIIHGNRDESKKAKY